MSLIVTYHLNKIRKLVAYETQVVSILGWYLVTTKPAISEIYDQIPQCLKVCNRNNSNTRMVLGLIFMMRRRVTVNSYWIMGGIQSADTFGVSVVMPNWRILFSIRRHGLIVLYVVRWTFWTNKLVIKISYIFESILLFLFWMSFWSLNHWSFFSWVSFLFEFLLSLPS